MTRLLCGLTATACLLLVGGCSTHVAVTPVDDASFVGGEDVSDADGSGEGDAGAVACLSATGTACPDELPRCVPDTQGGLSCAAAGDVPVGGLCGSHGADDCGVGALCINTATESGWRCRQICTSETPCVDAERCVGTILASQVTVNVCVP